MIDLRKADCRKATRRYLKSISKHKLVKERKKTSAGKCFTAQEQQKGLISF
jgi:hypothetical protein